VIARRALDFRASAEVRYRRRGVCTVPAPPSVLRRMPAPVRIDARVHVDARTLRLITSPQPVIGSARVESRPDAVTARLVERGQRAEPSFSPTPSSEAAAGAVPAVTVPRRADRPPPAPPVSMVLARSAPAGTSTVAASSIAASGGWSMATPGAPRSQPAISSTPEGALSRLNVNELTDRVVAAIDRRLLASRERLGG
jgi:hypothetical protein